MLPHRGSKPRIPEQLKDKIALGRIVRPRGLKGELRVQDFSGRPNLWEEIASVVALHRTGSVKQLHIERFRPGKGNIMFVQFKEITDIDEAENHKGSLLFSEPEEMPELEQGEFYVFELIGAEVRDTEDNILGHVVDVVDNPAHDVFVVESEKTGNRFPVPSVKDIVKDVDMENGKIIVKMIEGLDEIEA